MRPVHAQLRDERARVETAVSPGPSWDLEGHGFCSILSVRAVTGLLGFKARGPDPASLLGECQRLAAVSNLLPGRDECVLPPPPAPETTSKSPGPSYPSRGLRCPHLGFFRTSFVPCSVGDTEISEPWSLPRQQLLENGPWSLKKEVTGQVTQPRKRYRLWRLRGGEHGFCLGRGEGKLRIKDRQHFPAGFTCSPSTCWAPAALGPEKGLWAGPGPSPKKLAILVGEDY